MLDQVKDAAREIADARRKIAAMGPNFDEEILGATRALYAPLIRMPSAAVKVTADVAYGSDPRQKLDVYQPAGAAEHVLVYIPGGGFVAGDKNLDGVFYVNLGNYFASHGILTIVANYRLAPAHAWPAGAQDVAGAVAWARANAKSFGGDPARIVLFGQSAGSTHAATYLFDPTFHPAGQAGVAGILMSGPYLFQGELRPNLKAYFGDDPSRYAERSPLTHVGKSRTPLLLSVAEYDPAFLAAPTYELARAVTLRDGKSPSVAYFAGHNHVSTVMSFGTPQDDVGARVREFIASVG
ncbi:MAG: alpha/beta hydrolase [Xanthobacteraceae bacterium]|nr:alpha/beta hydrolase [Xanthobacteraceae bacterium]